jgi:hypothetical protein
MTVDVEALRAKIEAATPGPWRWQGEDYRGGWGWQMLVGAEGQGIIVGQGLDGKPEPALRAFQPVDPALCITGMAAQGRPHVEPVHVTEQDAALILAMRAAPPDLLTDVAALREALSGLLPGKLCGESWGLPNDESVSISVTFGAIAAARAALGNPS